MIFKKIWERHLLKEILKVFFLFLLSFYFLYFLIDYSIHVQEIIKNKQISLKDLGMYYAMIFSKRCDLLLPLALLIATLKVLCSLNRKNELLAFQAGGTSLLLLLRPFLIIALFCMTINYLNFELFIPRSLIFIERFEEQNFQNKKMEKKGDVLHVLPLKDGSRLIYQAYNREKNELFDVYWIDTPQTFCHMKTLILDDKVPIGNQVDTFYRSEKGLIEKKESYERYLFHSLKLSSNLKNYILKPIESWSISELIQLQSNHINFWKDKKDQIQTHLYLKLMMPWLSLFVIIGVAPYAVRFSRHLPVFLLFSISIFAYIAFFTLIGASVILGESHLIPPFWALFTIPIFFLIFFGHKCLKMGRCI